MELLKRHYDQYLQSFKEFHKKYEAYIPAIFFSSGFLLDVLTLGEIDDLSNIMILGFYLVGAIVILATEYLKLEVREYKNKLIALFYTYRNDIFHFLLGALLSAFTLFYFKSSSFANSFLFLFIMVGLLFLNELEIFQKNGVIIRSALTMLCFVSYLVYVIPIFLGATNALIFYSCTGVAGLLSAGAFYKLTKLNSSSKINRNQLLIPQLAVLFIYVSLYTFKILPPIPLSIKYIGIFHEVTKTETGYTTKDMKPWWQFWNNSDENFKARPDDKIFVLTNIFSPGGFAGKVYLRWLVENENGLQTSDRIPIKITGGRSEGFRGYAYKKNYTEGDWQVRIETSDGLEIGRINFTITKDNNTSERKFNIQERM